MPLEVRLAARARIAADVGDQLDARSTDQLDELTFIMVRVTDREDLLLGRHHRILPRSAGPGRSLCWRTQ